MAMVYNADCDFKSEPTHASTKNDRMLKMLKEIDW